MISFRRWCQETIRNLFCTSNCGLEEIEAISDGESTASDVLTSKSEEMSTLCKTLYSSEVNNLEEEEENKLLEAAEMFIKDAICHSSEKILTKIWKFQEDISEWTVIPHDVLVFVGDCRYSLHGDILRDNSSFFQQRLEGKEGFFSFIHVSSEHVSLEAFEYLLHFMYHEVILHLNCNKIEEVRNAARYLGICAVEKLWMEIDVSTGTLKREGDFCATTLHLNIQKTKTRAMGVAARNFESVAAGKEFLNLNKDQVMELLRRDNIGIRSEIIAFDAATKWLEYDRERREDVASDIPRRVKFAGLSDEEISACRCSSILDLLMGKGEIQKMLHDAASASEEYRTEMCQEFNAGE